MLDGAALIGRTVIAPGSQVYLSTCPPAATRVGAQGVDRRARGRLARAAGGQGLERRAGQDAVRSTTRAGLHGFTWDGSTDAGGSAAAGAYKIEVVAKVGDQNVSLKTSVAAHVSSVALDPATGALMLDTDTLGEIAMSDVERVL